MFKFPINYTLLFLLFSLFAQAQPAVLDSLRNAYEEANYIKDKTDILSQISGRYLYIKPDTALILLAELKELAHEANHEKALSEYYKQRGIIFHQRADNKTALQYIDTSLYYARLIGDSSIVAANLLNQAAILEQEGQFSKAFTGLSIAKDITATNGAAPNENLHAKALNNIGIIYMRLGLQTEGLASLMESLKIKQKIGDPQGIAITYGLISNLHTEREDHVKALEFVEKALAAAKEAGSKLHIGAFSMNMSEVYYKLKETNKADSLLSIAEDIANEMGHNFMLMHIRINQGERASDRGYYEKAEHQLIDNLKFARTNNLKFGEGKTLFELAKLEEKQSHYAKAIEYANAALEVFTQYSFNEDIPKAQKKLAELYEQRGQIEEAFSWYKSYQAHKDSVYTANNSGIIETLKAKHDFELAKKNYDLQISHAQQDTKSAKAKANKWFLFAMALVSLFLLIILVMTYYSLSQQRNAKDELTRSNKELYEANEKLEIAYLDIASSNQQLNIANNKLQQFAFAASHDLKESLRNITAYSQLIAKKIQSLQDSDKIQYYLEQIIRGGKNMYRLLEDLLKFTDEPSQNQQNEEIDIRETIETIQSVWTNRENESDIIHFSYNGNFPPLFASKPLIEQVFTNLIENAIKFRRPQVPLIIDVGVIKKDNRSIFFVKDNGIGVEKKYHKQVFDPFFRLYGRHISGSGMGLAIVKRIVENYQGNIWLESTIQEGTTIYFTLPSAVHAAANEKITTH